ncbi:MAG: hypothetical protein E7301_11800 [Butyrivibrio sp.]|nr:hypothetical protein [Butyrivibrio sp.]
MKKVFRKIIGLVMAATFAVSAFSVSKIDAKAATSINVNQEYRLTLKYGEVAEYTFTTLSDAVTNVSAAIVGGNSFTGAGMKLTVDYCNYDSGYIFPGEGRRVSENFVFAPGKTATLKFDSVGYGDTVDIAFTVNCSNPGNLEKESNNSPASATQIKLKKVYNGIVTYEGSDTDWYVFKAPKTGKYKFYAVNTMTDGYTMVLCEGFKSKTKKDTGFSSYLMAGSGWAHSKSVKLKKGKKYYIKFSGASYEKSIPVQIRVKKVK